MLSRVSEGATEKKRSEWIQTFGPQPRFAERGRSRLSPHTSRMGHGNRRSAGVSATGAEPLGSRRVLIAAVLFALLLSTFSSAIDQKKGKSETRRNKSPTYSAHGNSPRKGLGCSLESVSWMYGEKAVVQEHTLYMFGYIQVVGSV